MGFDSTSFTVHSFRPLQAYDVDGHVLSRPDLIQMPDLTGNFHDLVFHGGTAMTTDNIIKLLMTWRQGRVFQLLSIHKG